MHEVFFFCTHLSIKGNSKKKQNSLSPKLSILYKLLQDTTLHFSISHHVI